MTPINAQTVWLTFSLCWASVVLLVLYLRPLPLRRWAAWFLPLITVTALLLMGKHLTPAARLLFSTAGLLYILKATVLLRQSHGVSVYNRLGLLLYMTIWPGLDTAPFRARQIIDVSNGGVFVRGVVCAALGGAGAVLVALALPYVGGTVTQWAGIGALLLALHFGYANALPWLMRWVGFRVEPLFDAPLQSQTLVDFWSRRWNRAFVEMNRLLFLAPLRRRLGAKGAVLGVFLVSGLLHEGAISYPAGAGWGGPLLYFALHGILVGLEGRLRVAWWSKQAQRMWVAGWLLLPLPLLFHSPFRQACILPLYIALNQWFTQFSLDWWFDKALWLAGIGHFCILIASFQVPSRLGWKEDFAKLTRFNRKVFWTYGGFIVLCIVSFGILTLALHDELLRGDRAALGFASFNAVFWITRLLTDFFYFKHEDWPKGPQFVVGHVLLTGLFCALAAVYTGLIIYRGLFY